MNPEGEVIDLSAGDQPLYTDERLQKMIHHPDKNLRDMARKDTESYRQALELAAYGYDDEELELSPEEERIQSLHDEFGVDSDYEYQHVTRDKQPDTDWYGMIEQLKPVVADTFESAISKGETNAIELHKIMFEIPAFRKLYKKIDNEAPFEAPDILSYMQTMSSDIIKQYGINTHLLDRLLDKTYTF